MDDNTALATFGMSKADFGKALVEQAQNDAKKAAIGNLTGMIAHYQRAIASKKEYMIKIAQVVELYEARLAAIINGEFEVTNDSLVIFDEKRLNDPNVT